MKHLWIGGLLTVALLGAACSTSSSTGTTTTVHAKKSGSSTTAAGGSSGTTLVPGQAATEACTKFAAFKAGATSATKPTRAEVIAELKKSGDTKLEAEAKYWLNSARKKDTAKVTHAEKRITELCAKVQKTAPST